MTDASPDVRRRSSGSGTFPPRPRHELPLPDGSVLVLGDRTLVMGIVNVTPDSFSDGGEHMDPESAVAHALGMVDEGADLLDIGGESTRPGAPQISAEEQIRRTVPVVRALASRAGQVPISIDTRSAVVARAAAAAGAAIVNDVSGLAHDPRMRSTVAELACPAIVMHMRGTPTDMRERTAYDDVVEDVLRELAGQLALARAAGIEHLIADPGIGFAKTAAQSTSLLAATGAFVRLGVPLLVGPSRKSFLAAAVGGERPVSPDGRLHATVAAVTMAAVLGAHIVRVHDVGPCRDAVRVADLVRQASPV